MMKNNIPTSARELLKNMLSERWEKIAWYNHTGKDDLITIAKSYGFDDLVEHFNETYYD